MRTRSFGPTGRQVSEIGFGAWGIGGAQWGGADESESMATLHAALDQGIDFFDTADVYGDGLSERLIEIGVVPYYLHLLDRVRGAAHFDVPESRALELVRHLRETLPGYAVPRLARETPGEPSKTWLA